MKKEDYRTTIIFLLIILMLMLIGLNLSRISSFVTKEKALVNVYPEVIKSGEYIDIELNPPITGLYKKAYFCDSEDKCRTYFNIHCGSFKCQKHVIDQFKTYSDWKGIYYVRVFNYDKNNYEKAYFTVE